MFYLHLRTKKTPYELWKDKKHNLDYFHICWEYVLYMNDCEHLGKFDEGAFLGYSNNSRAFHVYNVRTHSIIASANVVYAAEEEMPLKDV